MCGLVCGLVCDVLLSDQFSKRVGFRSGSKAHKRHVVLVGGLSDGLLPVPYTQQLGQALDTKGWALVQVQTQPHTTTHTAYTYRRLNTSSLVAGCMCVLCVVVGVVVVVVHGLWSCEAGR